MLALHPDFLIDENRNTKAVVLKMEEWEQILEELEELEDIRAYDKAKQGTDEAIPFKQAVIEIRRSS